MYAKVAPITNGYNFLIMLLLRPNNSGKSPRYNRFGKKQLPIVHLEILNELEFRNSQFQPGKVSRIVDR